MGDLKTLKDFEINPKSWAEAMSNAGRKYTIDIDGFRQEAIKWIKELEKVNDLKEPFDRYKGEDICVTCKKEIDFVNYPDLKKHEHFTIVMDWEESSSIQDLIRWIKHFFSISEEELK